MRRWRRRRHPVARGVHGVASSGCRRGRRHARDAAGAILGRALCCALTYRPAMKDVVALFKEIRRPALSGGDDATKPQPPPSLPTQQR
ncbi:hypothetical protein EE612_021928 [Oryza sativa]|nr:hypothetical protein EE612_021928 [Oryza sativa]